MAGVTLTLETQLRSLDEARPVLEAELRSSSGTGLELHWNGDVLELSAPGTTGQIRLEDGRLVGSATFEASSAMHATIQHEISSAMRRAAGVAAGTSAILGLIERGDAHWKDGKPRGARNPVRLPLGKSAARMVLEDRR